MTSDALNNTNKAPPLNEELQTLIAVVQGEPSKLDEALGRIHELAKQQTDLHQISLAKLKLLVEAGQHDLAVEFATKMIPVLLNAVQDKLAVLAYRSLGKARMNLSLDAEQHRKLARALREQGQYRNAAWNYCQAEEKGVSADLDSITKICLQVAAEAEQADKPEEALAIYRFFLTKFPSTSMKEFITSSMEFQQMKIERQREEEANEIEL